VETSIKAARAGNGGATWGEEEEKDMQAVAAIAFKWLIGGRLGSEPTENEHPKWH